MKFINALAALAAGSLSYLVVANREKISQEISDTTGQITKAKDSYQSIQDNLAIIQSYQEPLKNMASDLQHKMRVYQQSVAGNIEQIQEITSKYATSDTK